MRLLYFVQDLCLITALTAATLFGVLVFNPPSIAEQNYCQQVNGSGLDYTACVLDRSI